MLQMLQRGGNGLNAIGGLHPFATHQVVILLCPATPLKFLTATARTRRIFALVDLLIGFADGFNYAVQIKPAAALFGKFADLTHDVLCAVLQIVGFKFDQALVVFDAAFFYHFDGKSLPLDGFLRKINLFGAPGDVPSRQQILDVAQRIRTKTRTHQRFGSRGYFCSAMKLPAAC